MATEQTVALSCPRCHRTFSASAREGGAPVACPSCQERFTAPPPISPLDVCRARAAVLGLRCVNLDQITIPAAILALVPEGIVRRDRIVPIELDGRVLVVAVSDPHAFGSLDRLSFELDRPVGLVMAPEDAIDAAIRRHYSPSLLKPAEPVPEEPSQTEIEFVEVAGEALPEGIIDPDSPAISNWIHQLIAEAFRIGAARILILPLGDGVKVAYRIHDAMCQRDDLLPRMLYPVLAKLMTMVNLHGEVRVSLGGQPLRLHASFRPTAAGLSAIVDIPQEVSPAAVCRAQAAKLGYRFVSLQDVNIPAAILEMVPKALVRQHRVLPIALEGENLLAVVPDPGRPEILETLRFGLNRPITLAMAPEGEILTAIDRYCGTPDPELAGILLRELARPADAVGAGPPADHQGAKPLHSTPTFLAAAASDHLRCFCGEGMLQLFESVRGGARLAKKDPATGNLEVVFPQAELMPQLPADARTYLENKIWALREAIMARLEDFLERDDLARGMALVYSQYAACRQIAEGRRASIDPAAARDAWVNFLCHFALRSFPAVDSNGTLLHLVSERLHELSAKLAALVDDAAMVADPRSSRQWIGRLLRQTITDEPSESEHPASIHLVELFISEALHIRAAALVLLPQEDRVEVAFRVQGAVIPGESFPSRLYYPVLARLASLAGPSGEISITKGKKKRSLHVRFATAGQELAALLEVVPDAAAANACREQAAKAGYEIVDLEKIEISPPLLALIPKAIAWKKRALPVAVRGTNLLVAVDTPPAPRGIDELKLAMRSPIEFALAPKDDILAAIYRHYYRADPSRTVSSTASSLLRATGKTDGTADDRR
jgi:type II secretory ATPase GspE/PulE/Tfp pilus assembly ATPase PilB-like protein